MNARIVGLDDWLELRLLCYKLELFLSYTSRAALGAKTIESRE
jgi:hypothetical protein